MRGERLFRILGLVDEDLIEEAASASSAAAVQRRSPPVWRRVMAAAACVTLLCAAGMAWVITGGFHGFGSSMTGDAGGGSLEGTPLYNGGTAFMSYAGPVLPLTTAEDEPDLTAERAVTWDFAPGAYQDGAAHQWGAAVTDAYTLTNSTNQDVSVTALYPFTGNFLDLTQTCPAVTLNGSPVSNGLYAGPYTGGFRDAGEDDGSTWNLSPISSWEGYQTLLESGAYQDQALTPYPALDQPVTVYAFENLAAPEGYDAATQAISFTIDESRTTILTYGFNGMEWDENGGGARRYSYFVPGALDREDPVKLLVVLGDDIHNYVLAGYENGACEREIDGVSCTVTRSVTTLGKALDQICETYAARYTGGLSPAMTNPFAATPLEMFQGAAAELLVQYGLLSDASMDRYSDGRLDDLLNEALAVDRVLYLAFEVTVPAGDSAEVSARLWKEPSFDFGGSGSENAGLQGFDLASALGSSLDFTHLTASLVNGAGIQVIRQNLGFDPASGTLTVTLDPTEAHYYLEIRPLEAD